MMKEYFPDRFAQGIIDKDKYEVDKQLFRELHQAGADNIIRMANWTSYLKATMYKVNTNVLQAM